MKKTLNIIKNIFTWLIVVLAICMLVFTIVSVIVLDRNDRSIFGYKAFIVLSDSMSETDFKAGDLIIAKEVNPATLQEGDIICYQSTNKESLGEIITHKIRERTKDKNGNPGFITYGTTTNTNDKNFVAYNFVIGKYQTKLTGAGEFFQFLKSTPGYIIFIFIPFMILLIMQGVTTVRLYRKYKKERQSEIQADRDELEAARAETARLRAELLELKAQMGCGGEQPETPPAPEDGSPSENN